MRTLAIIPARGGSKRLPGKNVKLLVDKPLIAWTIEFARTVTFFNEIQVSTDSEEIADVCRDNGIEVPRLRPASLATDEASSVDVVLDELAWKRSNGVEFDAIALLQPTTPVRFLQRWLDAQELLSRGDCDGVIGVAPAVNHPYLTYRVSENGLLESWVSNPSGITRSQDYPPAYTVNGALYLIKVGALEEQRTFVPNKCSYVDCAENIENIDIDTPRDWQIAEYLIRDWMKK